MKPILIYKGDDTIFADLKRFLTFNIETNLDLTGWKEQGGFSPTGTQPRTVNFLKPFRDTNYTVTIGDSNENGFGIIQSRKAKIYTKGVSEMTCTGVYTNDVRGDYQFYWYTCGY